MTSSLVGSEMCIRDRPKASADPPPRVQAAEAELSSPVVCAPSPSAPSMSVSYTHLTLPTICSV
eukprot:11347007-Prorocentrum_lima.AAC.1